MFPIFSAYLQSFIQNVNKIQVEKYLFFYRLMSNDSKHFINHLTLSKMSTSVKDSSKYLSSLKLPSLGLGMYLNAVRFQVRISVLPSGD